MSCCPLTSPAYEEDKHCDIPALCVKYGMVPAIQDLECVVPSDFYIV